MNGYEKSLATANAYFEKWIGDNTESTFQGEAADQIELIDRKINWSIANQQSTAELQKQKQSVIKNPNDPEEWEIDDQNERIKIAEMMGVKIPKDLDPEILDDLVGQRRIWQERLKNTEPPAFEYTLQNQVSSFLAIEKSEGKAEQTYNKVVNRINRIKNTTTETIINGKPATITILSESMDVRNINTTTVDQFYVWVKSNYESPRKVFGFFRRLLKHMIEREVIDPIANLNCKRSLARLLTGVVFWMISFGGHHGTYFKIGAS